MNALVKGVPTAAEDDEDSLFGDVFFCLAQVSRGDESQSLANATTMGVINLSSQTEGYFHQNASSLTAW